MNPQSVEDIQRFETSDGLKLVFPWRDPPKPLRKQIRSHVVTGCACLVAAGCLIGWLVGAEVTPPLAVVGLTFAGTGVAVFLGRGLGLMWTRSEIVIRPDGLLLVEQEGLIRRERNRPWKRIEKLAVHHVIHVEDPDQPRLPSEGVIEVVGRGAQTLWFAHDYPRQMLLSVADELARSGGVPHEEAPFTGGPCPKMKPFFVSEVEDVNTLDADDQPAASESLRECRGDTLNILIRPRAFWRSGQALPVAITVTVSMGSLAYSLWEQPNFAAVNPLAPVAAVAAGLFAIVYLWYRRETLFHVENGELTVVEIRPILGSKTSRVHREEIQAIRRDLDYTRARKGATETLNLYLINGKVRHFLEGGDPEEMLWVATELRRALDRPAVAQRLYQP